MKRTRIRKTSKSETAKTKERIQALLRQIVILRDGGCVLRNIQHPDIPPCNGYRKDGELILQADHLITRGNSATYADPRLVVCVCKGHHGWKSVGSNLRKEQYDEIVKTILPKERVQLWDRCEEERWKPQPQDWSLTEIALKAELKTYKIYDR